MEDEMVTRGGSITEGLGLDYPHTDLSMETSVIFGLMPLKGFPGSGIPTIATLDLLEQRLHTLRQTIEVKNQHIRELQQQVYSMSRQLESSANSASESEEDLGLDYSTMESQARVEIPSGVNWKAVPRTTTYSELFGTQYELDVEER
jgi:hypothetical protein